MIYVGVDPGSHRTGVAAVNQDGSLRFVQCLASDDGAPGMIRKVALELRIPGDDFVFAVEDQEYRHERSRGSPALIFPFAQVAGAAASILAHRSKAKVVLVTPMGWKGSVPKLQHHRRLCTRLGWEWDEKGGKKPYVVPIPIDAVIPGFDEINQTEWPEVLDALGIALWLKEKHRHGQA